MLQLLLKAIKDVVLNFIRSAGLMKIVWTIEQNVDPIYLERGKIPGYLQL
uniref:Uncharacterized protein n=1 Tax=Tetranychus urticae TaxID=32264 RepID=T1JQF2_TETUR